MERIKTALKNYWGYDGFLPLQNEAMSSALAGRDSLVVLPTGGGKSLCFQAPAVVMPGLAIVVSPLISLMKDQVDALAECGVPAARLDSTQSGLAQNSIIGQAKDGNLKLLYLAPERLMANGFIHQLKDVDVSFVAVDEAHCVSMWGHDFRPEYRQLGQLKEIFPGVTIHGYTATATDHVRNDIVEQLRLADPEVLVGSFDRPNLVYKVNPAGDIAAQVSKVLDRHRNESGIVYCIRRVDVDAMCAKLSARGYRVLPYHAGMEGPERKQNQEAFIAEEVDTIVATIAFGMGIDKSNVRYVIHTGMPKSLEHYQQESGRAGRDGLEAECILFYSGGDFGIWKYLIGDMPDQPRKIAEQKLNHMYSYCTAASCRHQALVAYFGQTLDKDNCAACDMCLDEKETIADALVIGQKILSCVLRLDERFGADYTALVLTGSREQRILDNGHDGLSTYGLLQDCTRRTVRDWIEQLVGQGRLAKEGEYNVLKVTALGWQVLRGEQTPQLLAPAKKPTRASKVARDSWEGVDHGLFEVLRLLRHDIAAAKGIPAFIVFSDVTLRDMARLRPSSSDGFLSVNGVGKMKSRQYGRKFLAAIAEYCQANPIEMDVTAAKPLPVAKLNPAGGTKPNIARERAFTMFSQGHSIEKVAATVDRVVSTTVKYLEEFIAREEIADSSPWVEPQTHRRVEAAAHQCGVERLRPIYDHLNGEIGYEEIRICLACLAHADQADPSPPSANT